MSYSEEYRDPVIDDYERERIRMTSQAEALAAAVERYLDNVDTGSYESSGLAQDELRAALAAYRADAAP